MLATDELRIADVGAASAPKDVTLKQRLLCLQELAREAAELELDVLSSEEGATEALYAALEKDVETLQKMKLQKERALQEDRLQLESLQKHLGQLRAGRARRRTAGETRVLEDVEATLKRAKQVFMETREDLAEALNAVMNDDPAMKTIILEVTKAFFAGGDSYVQVEEDWAPCLELLCRGRVVAFHPYNKNKIRLAALE
ncbi:uncharacterized protein LOC134539065 isoform X2 [Bacillus rossius redtenbacheri]